MVIGHRLLKPHAKDSGCYIPRDNHKTTVESEIIWSVRRADGNNFGKKQFQACCSLINVKNGCLKMNRIAFDYAYNAARAKIDKTVTTGGNQRSIRQQMFLFSSKIEVMASGHLNAD